MAADDAAAGQDDWILGVGDHGCGCFNLVFQRCFAADGLVTQGLFIVANRHMANVDGQIDEGCARFFPFGVFEGQTRNFGHRVRTDDGIGPARNRFKHSAQVQILMGCNVHLVRTYLTGNGDQRCAVAVCIGNACNEVCSPRSEGSHADAGVTCQTAVDVSHEGSTLFVTDGDEFDFRLFQGFHNGEVFFTGNTKNIMNAFFF